MNAIVGTANARKKVADLRTTFTVVSANLPESGKKGLIADRAARAARAYRIAISQGASVLLVQESGTMLELAAKASRNSRPEGVSKRKRAHVGWGSYYAPPSTVVAGGKRERGNGVHWRRRTWRLVEANVISVPWPKSATDALYIAVVLLEHRATGELVLFWSTHAPTQVADRDNSTRNAINAKVRLLAKEASRRHLATIGGLDANDGRWIEKVAATDLKAAEHHGPDWLVYDDESYIDLIRGWTVDSQRTSDHRIVCGKFQLAA